MKNQKDSVVEEHGIEKGPGNKNKTKLPTMIKMAVVKWCNSNGIVYNHENESFTYDVSDQDIRSKKTDKKKTFLTLYANYFERNGKHHIVYANNSKKLNKPVRINLNYHLAAEYYFRKLINGRIFKGEESEKLKKLLFD